MLQETIETLFKCTICLFFTNSPDKYLKHSTSSTHYKKCCIKEAKDIREAGALLKQENKNIIANQLKIVKNPDEFLCKCCKIDTKNKKGYDKHILSTMHINLQKYPDYNNRKCDFCSEGKIKYIAGNRYTLHKHYEKHHDIVWIDYIITDICIADKFKVYCFINSLIILYIIKMNRCKKMKYDDVYPIYKAKFDKYSADKVEFIKLYGLPENLDDIDDTVDNEQSIEPININQEILDKVNILKQEIKELQDCAVFGGTDVGIAIKNKEIEKSRLLKTLRI